QTGWLSSDGGMREHAPAPSFRQERGEHVVDRLAHDPDDLVAQGEVDRSLADEGIGALGAPPVELEAALAPVAPLPLPQRAGRVAVLAGVLVEPQRELPAHVGLPVHGPLAGFEGGAVQRTPGAPREAGTVEEDAGVVDEARRASAVGLC